MALILLLFALLGACAMPPARREARSRLVQPGFTEEMVSRAMGNPERKYTRTTPEGTFDVWAYIRPEDREPPPGARIGFEGGVYIAPEYYYGVETPRIVFKDGKVVAVERVDLKSAAPDARPPSDR